MLTIRLQRGGKRNNPQYKLVLARTTAANQKQFVEVLGSYNPHTKDLQIKDQARLDYWLKEQHVPTSETVHNLFVTKNIIDAPKVTAFSIPKKEVAEEVASTEEAPTETTTETPATEETLAEESAPTETPAEPTPETEETPVAPEEALASETSTEETSTEESAPQEKTE